MIGQTLDRYRIESKLGEGGMGVVYKAHDTHLDRTVAIKVLPHDKVSDPERKQRFVQEAKAASALNHPNIVTVHDIRSDAGVDFIVMEYAGARTLDQIIPAKGLGITQSLRFGAQIADALARAHEAGIVHRDVKPSNVIVTDDHRVKVLDFGLAKLFEPSARAAEARTQTTPLTDAGMVVGTAAYMSPEQAEGREVDARSDIFSFGTVLYEMVTGRRPFVGDSNLSVMAKILNEDPAPPSGVVASISSDVERTILRCLRKDPARRYQTMADLKVALDDLAADSAAGLPAQTPAARRVSTLALGMGCVRAGRRCRRLRRLAVRRHRQRARRRCEPCRSRPCPGVTRSPSFSPDGNQVAFAWTGPDGNNPDIYVQQIGAGAPLRLTTNPGNDYSPMWSPDGRWIAFLRGEGEGRRHELRLVPPLGGPERKLTEIQPRGFLRPVTLAWCPDSSCVVVTDSIGDGRPDALFAVSLDSGERRPLTILRTRCLPTAILRSLQTASGWPSVARSRRSPGSSRCCRWEGCDRGRRTASSHDHRLRRVTTPGGRPTAPRSCSAAKAALWRLGISGDGTPERLPFVGEDGVTPIVSSPQAGRSGASCVRAELHRRQHLAHRDVYLPARRPRLRRPSRSPRPTGRHRTFRSRWAPRDVHVNPIGRERNLAGGRFRG